MEKGIQEFLSTLTNHVKENITVNFVEYEKDGSIHRDTFYGELECFDVNTKRIVMEDHHKINQKIPFKGETCVVEKIESPSGVIWEIDFSKLKGIMTQEEWNLVILEAYAKKFTKEE